MYLRAIRVLSGIANNGSNYDCSNPCSFPDSAFSVIFLKVFQKKKLKFNCFYKKFKMLIQMLSHILCIIRIKIFYNNYATIKDLKNEKHV